MRHAHSLSSGARATACALQVLVLEYLSGGELLKQLQRMKRYSEANACQMFKQVRARKQALPAFSAAAAWWAVGKRDNIAKQDASAAQDAGSCFEEARRCCLSACMLPALVPQRTILTAAAALLPQVVDAVAYLHSLGILHRDIKPENCLLAKPASHYATKNKPVKVRTLRAGVAGVPSHCSRAESAARDSAHGCHPVPACASTCTLRSAGDTVIPLLTCVLSPARCVLLLLPAQVKLIDLGMAGLYRPNKPVHGCMGSPGFIAPEIILGEPHTVRSSLRSFFAACCHGCCDPVHALATAALCVGLCIARILVGSVECACTCSLLVLRRNVDFTFLVVLPVLPAACHGRVLIGSAPLCHAGGAQALGRAAQPHAGICSAAHVRGTRPARSCVRWAVNAGEAAADVDACRGPQQTAHCTAGAGSQLGAAGWHV